MDLRCRLANLMLAPPGLRGAFALAFVVGWVGVMVVAAGILYIVVGGPPLSEWQRAVVLFFWWPWCVGGPCLETPYGWLAVLWLTFLAWGIARVAVWLRWRSA